ncbi:hypothetical protein H1D32_05505 [Anaerobacillus sp. CMMVII]|uniref:spore germination protein n=1 Tax=Anaerobacillus sp. CMMVII TaxID=2755588 RepID=UPI0021B7B6B8|nr:spore germination protein [Anaerobacillus sp. CMMVII]MCT8137246.1 hypothetical protein [Anaerobacillus sp. CMMVII]
MKPFRTPMTTIGNLKITNISGGASINFGPAFHKGHQANAKIETGEIVIGDEINIGCPPADEEETEENENETNEEIDEVDDGEEDNEEDLKKRWKWKEGKFQKED